jgi:hypothetical protein
MYKLHSCTGTGCDSDAAALFQAKRRYENGASRVRSRKARAATSLAVTPPKPEEIHIIHHLYLDTLRLQAEKESQMQERLNAFFVRSAERLAPFPSVVDATTSVAADVISTEPTAPPVQLRDNPPQPNDVVTSSTFNSPTHDVGTNYINDANDDEKRNHGIYERGIKNPRFRFMKSTIFKNVQIMPTQVTSFSLFRVYSID